MFLARESTSGSFRKRLKVYAQDEEFFARPFLATDDPAEIGTADLVVFAVKGYDLRAAAHAAAPLVGPETAVLPLLNGVNSPDILAAELPPCRLLNGCVYISARIEGPGIVRQTGGSRKLFFGPVSGSRETVLPVEEMPVGDRRDRGDERRPPGEKFIFRPPAALFLRTSAGAGRPK